MAKRRHYHAHETARQDALDGVPLATFWQRVLGFWIDTAVGVLLWFPIAFAWARYHLHQKDIDLTWDFHEKGNIVVIVLYWGLSSYFGNGRTLGKWIAHIQVVSLTGSRLGFWQSIERSLGYGAALLEGGLGFLQFFWDRNRQCAQDRLAETIVVDTRKSSKRQEEKNQE